MRCDIFAPPPSSPVHSAATPGAAPKRATISTPKPRHSWPKPGRLRCGCARYLIFRAYNRVLRRCPQVICGANVTSAIEISQPIKLARVISRRADPDPSSGHVVAGRQVARLAAVSTFWRFRHPSSPPSSSHSHFSTHASESAGVHSARRRQLCRLRLVSTIRSCAVHWDRLSRRVRGLNRLPQWDGCIC